MNARLELLFVLLTACSGSAGSSPANPDARVAAADAAATPDAISGAVDAPAGTNDAPADAATPDASARAPDAPVTAPDASGLIGTEGGIVTSPEGASISVPAGALATPTPLAVVEDTAGAPPLPAGVRAVGAIFAFTPHGTTFASAATITVPFDPTDVAAGETPVLLKTDATQTAWVDVTGATLAGSTMTGAVTELSWVAVAIRICGGVAKELVARDFPDTDWVESPPKSNASNPMISAARQVSGGNVGPYRQAIYQYTSSGSLLAENWDTASAYAPTTGAFSGIYASFDARATLTPTPSGMASVVYYFALEQGGVKYRSVSNVVALAGQGWAHEHIRPVTGPLLRPTDFMGVNGPANNPNFKQDGAPITFGYIVMTNSGMTPLTYVADIDNLRIELCH